MSAGIPHWIGLITIKAGHQFSSVQSLSCVQLFVTPWTAERQASLSITNSQGLPKLIQSRWCHPTISSTVVPFSCPQSFPASGSFQMSQLFTSGGQSIGVSASTSVLPMNTQDWLDLLAVQGTLKSLLHIPGSGRTSGEGNDNPLQCSCLENPMCRGAWRATVHWVTKSQTQLNN